VDGNVALGGMNPRFHSHCRDCLQKWTISKTIPTPIRTFPASNSHGWAPPASTKSRPTIVDQRPIAVRVSRTFTLLRGGFNGANSAIRTTGCHCVVGTAVVTLSLETAPKGCFGNRVISKNSSAFVTICASIGLIYGISVAAQTGASLVGPLNGPASRRRQIGKHCVAPGERAVSSDN
jgi:hypothetical protein